MSSFLSNFSIKFLQTPHPPDFPPPYAHFSTPLKQQPRVSAVYQIAGFEEINRTFEEFH